MNLASPQSNAADAARLLTQGTFGPTPSLLAHVQVVGFRDFSLSSSTPRRLSPCRGSTPRSPPYHQIRVLPTLCFRKHGGTRLSPRRTRLRQRVAFALSEIFVASSLGNDITNYPDGVATYWDLLARDAFGNFRQLLEDVTLNPMMGDYLDMVHNDKPHPENNTEPNENYAREVMQLFTIGLYKLNPDGNDSSMIKISRSQPTTRMWSKVSRMFSPDGIGRKADTALELRTPAIIASRCRRSQSSRHGSQDSAQWRDASGRTNPEPGPARRARFAI